MTPADPHRQREDHMRKLIERDWHTGRLLQAGDFFCIKHKGHFAHGEIHQAKRVKQERVHGYDDDLDLGIMVEFVIEDYYGQPCRHLVPIEWCELAKRPSIASRVKNATRPERREDDLFTGTRPSYERQG
jgi:hypothetical protein